MKFKYLPLLFLSIISTSLFAQKPTKNTATPIAAYPANVNRPKLVVGMVVDQMRWDYLNRFYSRYGNGGFKRLINDGFSIENTMIPYVPTLTACGHASIYTGSVPAITGVIGNNWFDPQAKRDVYCVEDKDAKTIGSTSVEGIMSPKNLLVTTITDELRLATNFKSKVISVSIKDRGAILPGGHTANGAYWYDDATGNFITSSHYMNALPEWVKSFNAEKWPDKFFAEDWKTIYPIETYTQSTRDDNPYEKLFKGETTSTFPHLFNQYINKNYSLMASMPQGNTLTLKLAKSAVANEQLGQAGNTDFLAVSLSSTDYVGHQFGPNSIEVEDTYLRLDRDLEDFFKYLDKTVGKGNYLFFITADHGGTHVPSFSKDNKMPGGGVLSRKFKSDLDSLISSKFKLKKTILAVINNQIIFDKDVINGADADFSKIKQLCLNYLIKQEGVYNAVDIANLSNSPMPQDIKNRIANGYNPRRSGDIYYLFYPGYYSTAGPGTGHGSWNPYDSHIPLVFMGWNVKAGKTNETHYMTDIAATVAAMLRIQMPSGCIGSPIAELTH